MLQVLPQVQHRVLVPAHLVVHEAQVVLRPAAQGGVLEQPRQQAVGLLEATRVQARDAHVVEQRGLLEGGRRQIEGPHRVEHAGLEAPGGALGPPLLLDLLPQQQRQRGVRLPGVGGEVHAQPQRVDRRLPILGGLVPHPADVVHVCAIRARLEGLIEVGPGRLDPVEPQQARRRDHVPARLVGPLLQHPAGLEQRVVEGRLAPGVEARGGPGEGGELQTGNAIVGLVSEEALQPLQVPVQLLVGEEAHGRA